MTENDITFKATVNGLVIVLKEEDDFEVVMEGIQKKLDSSGRFFKGASLAVKYRGRKLSKEEEHQIKTLMVSKTGAEIRSFEEEIPDPLEQAVLQNSKTSEKSKPMKKHLYFRDIEQGMTKFHQGTVRSGQRVCSEGNLVIIGDVNPGAEIVAAGNIVVMGSLRGTVHAGVDGNKEAKVVALHLNPTQLRIADVITRSPDELVARGAYIPEMAFVKEEVVYIERFLPQSRT